MPDSHAVRVAGGVSAMLLKYSARNWPVGHGVLVIVKLTEFDVLPSALRTVMGTEPAMAMSAAAMLAVSCVPLMNVVGRGAPFQVTVEPLAKPLPVTVSVKSGPPAVRLGGVRAVIRGPGTALPVATRHAPRPNVKAKSVWTPFIVVTESALVETAAKPVISTDHVSPPSVETKTPASLPM